MILDALTPAATAGRFDLHAAALRAAHGLRSLAAGESCEMSMSLDVAVL